MENERCKPTTAIHGPTATAAVPARPNAAGPIAKFCPRAWAERRLLGRRLPEQFSNDDARRNDFPASFISASRKPGHARQRAPPPATPLPAVDAGSDSSASPGSPSVNIEQPHSVQSVHSQQPQQQQQQQPQPQQIPQLQQPSATQTAAYKTKLMQMRVHYDDLVKVRDRMKRDRVRVDRLDKMLDLLDNKLGNVKCDVQFLDRMHSSIKQLIHKHTIGRPLLDAMNTIIKENRKMDNWMPFPDPWANFKHMEIKVPDEVVKIMAKDGNADYVAEAKRRRLIGPESDVQAVPDLKISEAHPAVAELEKIEIDCQQGTKKFTFTGPASAELGAYDWDVDTPPMSHHAESAVVKIRSREPCLETASFVSNRSLRDGT
ncbi:hypothetical protein L596_023151 [Steinernema carpocapsae]|uniref:Uncharacterized protein n=1 Tax=Steinernema carpocapsae TaxID=34508 RepID=A0A4U5MCT6_STECR|nr:hypothetical protein L596_023151 [Steinernema carpocapsae]